MKSYVFITGATGGLGKAFTAECASRGWDLFLTDVSEQKLEALAEGITRLHGVNVLYLPSDLTNADSRSMLWEHIHRLGLRFHALINVAGLDFEGPFSERPLSDLVTIIRLNIEATVEMTRRTLRYRNPARVLRIINVSSLASFYPMPMKAVYAASKRFLLDFSMALNQELRDSRVSVTALCPAGLPTRTDIINKIDAQGFMGQITTMNVGRVAAITIDRSLAGRPVYIPGFINQVLRSMSALLPANTIATLIGKRWRKTWKATKDFPELQNCLNEQAANG